jgi:hypothetical protein
MTTTQFTLATILKLERKNNSVNGNPRYEVYYQDEDGNFGHATTASDHAFCYGIANDMYRESDPRVMATLEFTKSGRISNLLVTKKLWS